MKEIKVLKQRILDISKKLGLAHIGSCISILPILVEIYQNKKPEDLVILDGAHGHLAHLVVQEWDFLKRADHIDQPYESGIEMLISELGIHCDRKMDCDVSGGSLGHGIGIGIGLALANEKRNVHVMVTDGSMAEGSNWEALRIKFNLAVTNLKIYCNFNGFSAVAPVNIEKLEWQMKQFCPDIKVYYTDNGLGENKVEDHYIKL